MTMTDATPGPKARPARLQSLTALRNIMVFLFKTPTSAFAIVRK